MGTIGTIRTRACQDTTYPTYGYNVYMAGDFSERLAWARANAGYKSPRAAAEELGWNPNTYKSHENGIRANKRPPEEQTVRKYARAFKVDYLWLYSGEGEPPKPRKGGEPLVTSYDPDAPDTTQDPDAPALTVYPPDAIKELAAQAGMGSGQVISTTYRVHGEENVAQDEVREDFWRIPSYFVRHVLGTTEANLLVLEGKGDSMSPTINSGDRVLADLSHKKPSPDGLYAIRDALDEIVVKRLELVGANPPRIRIISDNPKHGMQEVGIDEIAIVGKVVFAMKLM
jgi:phage repressor protein C with HTH and peptisase S24 domain